jgi:hypothetical protein
MGIWVRNIIIQASSLTDKRQGHLNGNRKLPYIRYYNMAVICFFHHQHHNVNKMFIKGWYGVSQNTCVSQYATATPYSTHLASIIVGSKNWSATNVCWSLDFLFSLRELPGSSNPPQHRCKSSCTKIYFVLQNNNIRPQILVLVLHQK